MQNKLINFKEWDWKEIHIWLLSDQVRELEFKIVKCKDKEECEKLRKRLRLVNEAINKNRLDFNL
jgi:hypothetical protein